MLVKKVILISLALVLSFSFWGCTDIGDLSQAEADQMVANAIDAYPEINTAKFDMDMLMTIEIAGGSDPGKMTESMDFSGVLDFNEREMQLAASILVDIPGVGTQDMNMDCYLVEDWMYANMEMTGESTGWIKAEITDGVWEEQFEATQIEQQIEFLRTAESVRYVGSETVNGADCYVFEIAPDMDELLSMLYDQEETTGIDFSELPDLSNLLQEMSLKTWIAKDNYLAMKTEVYMQIELRPSDVEATEDDFSTITINMNMTISIYDLNEPVSITVPPEALGAVSA